MTKQSSDDSDLDDTDELPVLLEPVEDAAEPFAVARPDDTSEHTELFAPGAHTEGSEAELAQRAGEIPALEAQIRVLTDGMRDLEQRLAEKDERLEELRAAAAASAPQWTGASTANEGPLATELADRDAQIAELIRSVEHLEAAAAARSADLERLREAANTRHGEAEELRRALAARPLPDTTQPSGDDLREAYSTLRSYVAGRHAWWDEMQETNARLATRATELEQELAASAKRLAAAEAFAAKESERAVGLRAELVGYARRVEALRRELKELRAPGSPELTPIVANGILPPPNEAAHAQPTAPDGLAPEAPPLLTDAVDAIQPAVEAIAQLEAEVEYKRQQVAAQLVELRDREQQLQAAMSEIGALRTELDDSRSNLARLERTVVDKDRALEARDLRIAALHDELKQQLGGVEKRGAGDFSRPTMDSSGARRAIAHEGAGNIPAPALICLTGDAPKRFPLTKKTITVGRGPHCDLQIITHFVSREHARLTISGDTTLIEDLGSRNGVFVNSMRVDRRHLQQGDLVTIGETQFRFVESMAH